MQDLAERRTVYQYAILGQWVSRPHVKRHVDVETDHSIISFCCDFSLYIHCI